MRRNKRILSAGVDHGRASTLSATFAGIVISAVSIIAVGVLPMLVGLYVRRFGIDLSRAGWLLTVQFTGTGVGTLAAYWLIGRHDWRTITAVSALVATAAAVAAPYVPGYWVLLLCIAVAGCGSGITYCVAIAVLGQSSQPERVFAGSVTAQGASFALYAMVLPRLAAHGGTGVALATVGVWYALIVILSPLLPRRGHGSDPDETTAPAVSAFRFSSGLAALLGLLFFSTAIFAFWGYAEQIGSRAGLNATAIGNGVAVGFLVGILAGAVPGIAGARLGRVRMILLAAGFVLVGLAFLVGPRTPAHFLAGSVSFNLGWAMGVAYFMALIAHRDDSGRFVRLIPSVQVASGMIGPFIVASVIGRNILIVNTISAAFCVAAMIFALLSWMRASDSARRSGVLIAAEK